MATKKTRKATANHSTPDQWMLALETHRPIQRARRKFLRGIKGSTSDHWYSFLSATRLAIKRAPDRRQYKDIFNDIVEQLKEWFNNIDWDKWLPILWEIAKVVIPILVLLIL